jgi:hypothetical protein
MPTYDYTCDDCIDYAINQPEAKDYTKDEIESAFTFEARYSFHASKKEARKLTECPFCDGHNTRKMITSPMHVRVCGHNWEDFKKENAPALRRDMALHQLQNEDPYAHIRPDGEADDLAHRLRTGGDRDKNTNKKYFVMKSPKSAD